MKRAIRNLLAFCVWQMSLSMMFAQIVSPFNERPIVDTSANYSFIVSGHFHGSSKNHSTYPASTVLANLDTINSLNASFLMSLGDLFLDVDSTYLEHYRSSLFSKLKMPLINAVGNHDVSNGNLYEKVYGKTFFSFVLRSELFIVLNTEVNDGSIQDAQLDFLKAALKQSSMAEIKNVFVFSHRPVWAEGNPKFEGVFEGNTRSRIGAPNFESEIRPLLQGLAKPVYWLSGSLAEAPSSFFYSKEENSNLTFMQTAIRDVERDAVLLVTVKGGSVSFKGVSLTGKAIDDIENFDIGYWKKTHAPENEFNFRLLPLYTIQMVCHSYFWIGFASSLVLLLLFSFIKRKWKKSK